MVEAFGISFLGLGFGKMRGTFLGVPPIIRIIVFWRLHWDSRNYQFWFPTTGMYFDMRKQQAWIQDYERVLECPAYSNNSSHYVHA